LLSAGIKIKACAITPSVVPNPSMLICAAVTESAVGIPDIAETNIAAVAITITLLIIGAYIGNENELREFRICAASVYSP
jgi:hypothetical protein